MTTQKKDIKQKFFDSLRRGTGEAYILLKENQQIDFSDLIIKGAVRNFSYDNQSEGSRADYIYKLFKSCKQKDKIVKAVLTKLQNEKDDDYGLYQMCDLAVKFYKEGYIESKQALYYRFEKNIFEDYAYCGTDQVMEIGGIEGVLKVAELRSKFLSELPDDYPERLTMDWYQEKNKNIDVYKELKKASATNSSIKLYLNHISREKLKKNKRTTTKRQRFTYELVKEVIEKNELWFLSSDRNKELTEKEVEKLANEFLDEKDNVIKERYLRFFSSRKFPFDYKPILNIAREKNPRKTRLVEYAVESLKYFSAKEIRELVLEKLSTEKNPCNYLQLLVSNYKKGDYKLLIEVANRSGDYNYIHSIVFGFIEIYKANATKECKEPLETIYNKMNCGLHRKDILKILIDNNVLSDQIFEELQFDSYYSVRKLYKKYKNIR